MLIYFLCDGLVKFLNLIWFFSSRIQLLTDYTSCSLGNAGKNKIRQKAHITCEKKRHKAERLCFSQRHHGMVIIHLGNVQEESRLFFFSSSLQARTVIKTHRQSSDQAAGSDSPLQARCGKMNCYKLRSLSRSHFLRSNRGHERFRYSI